MAINPKRNHQVEPKATLNQHEEANLAYLIDLVISDTQYAIGAELKRLINHPATQREDFEELSNVVAKYSDELHLPPKILAYALLQWFSESDRAPSTPNGSANWMLEAPHIGFDRRDLTEQFELIHQLLLDGLYRGREDPEECLDRCIALHAQLGNVLRRGKSNIATLKGKRKQLFYALSKVRLQAFYLSEVRGCNLDSPRIQQLLVDANTTYDLRQNGDRKAAQKQLYDWCRSVRELVLSVDQSLGPNSRA